MEDFKDMLNTLRSRCRNVELVKKKGLLLFSLVKFRHCCGQMRARVSARK